ncbi:hypothetical protein CCACVL1_28248 [Corchorus capsularis]|uniref:HTH myb-type domain-containing protein n=1 Tax=Corchorus capsularis TaxID=210143 RepID=A0A1R3G7B3_COCAP|nr:hypothetical protein CCACVL1_28248 [Corchorus capsularis]
MKGLNNAHIKSHLQMYQTKKIAVSLSEGDEDVDREYMALYKEVAMIATAKSIVTYKSPEALEGPTHMMVYTCSALGARFIFHSMKH